MARDNSRGHGKATNGPYSWGNGPKPKGKGCAVVALALVGLPVAAIAAGAVEAARAFGVI